MRRLNSLWALFLCLAAWHVIADAPNEATAAQALNRRLADIRSLQADFTQTTIDASNRTLQANSGHLWVAKPSKFRIETTKPYVQTLVSNGVDFWTWDADLEQVIVKKLDADVKQVPILLLGGDTARITSEYKVSYYKDGDSEHYTLQAQSTSSLFETLGIEFVKGQPSAISITDSLGQQTRILLNNVSINQPINDGRFAFTPPKGADVIDDRNAQ